MLTLTMNKKTGLLFFFCLILHFVSAQTPIVYENAEEVENIGKQTTYLEEGDKELSINDVLSSTDFQSFQQKVPNLGTTNSTYWVKISIQNQTETENLVLQLAHPTVDYLDFYYQTEDGTYKVYKTGDRYKFSQRVYNHQNFIFDIDIPKGETKDYYFRMKSGEQMLLPLTLGKQKSIFEVNVTRDLISGLYFGIIFVMLFYNLFVYISVRDRSYLIYILYILAVGLTQAGIQGYIFKYIFPGIPYLANLSVFIVTAMVGIMAVEFLKEFLHTKEYQPKLHKGFRFFIGLYLVAIALALSGVYYISYNMLQMNAMLTSMYMMFVAYKIYKQGYRPAKFFLIAWSIFLTGVVVFVLKDFNVFPYNELTYYILQIGSAIEVVLLSIALADKINILQQEKEIEQAKAFEALEENQRIIREQNVMLEQKVKERTVELEQSNSDLNVALVDLKEAQIQLVDAEKMASLGQLTAGIAHEINNPINFVTSNIRPLRRDIDDILSIVKLYDELNPDIDVATHLKKVNDLKEELEADFLIEEIDMLLKGIDEGANRTAEIVKGLKNFSRLDEADLKLANLNEGLDSTLTLLNSNMGGVIEVEKNYEERVEIECYAGKINQVFMNILSNGIQALQEQKDRSSKPVITISTKYQGDNAVISIKDNGPGMSEEVQKKIFEPFFTTKDVGEGTGLGLSITFSIIESHNGNIKVESEEGVGTEFIITLPKTHQEKVENA